jgi:hypothetical protein
MRLLPRFAARAWASLAGYFWTPCRICGREFGGFEWDDYGGHDGNIPKTWPLYNSSGFGICPTCTRQGVGCFAHAACVGVTRVHVGHGLHCLSERWDPAAVRRILAVAVQMEPVHTVKREERM